MYRVLFIQDEFYTLNRHQHVLYEVNTDHQNPLTNRFILKTI